MPRTQDRATPAHERIPGWKPTRADLTAAAQLTVPDLLVPGLQVLFCGINPGLYTAATGHHFARPGNRFWPVLHAAGFTPRQFAPWEQHLLLPLGFGITNVVARTTATAAELSAKELTAGGVALVNKVKRNLPRVLAVLGLGAYRSAFDAPKAVIGPQEYPIGTTQVWVLPNPSGLNANYQRDALTALFADLRVSLS